MHHMIEEIKFLNDEKTILEAYKEYLKYIRSTLQEQREQTAVMARIDTSLEYVEKLLKEVK